MRITGGELKNHQFTVEQRLSENHGNRHKNKRCSPVASHFYSCSLRSIWFIQLNRKRPVTHQNVRHRLFLCMRVDGKKPCPNPWQGLGRKTFRQLALVYSTRLPYIITTRITGGELRNHQFTVEQRHSKNHGMTSQEKKLLASGLALLSYSLRFLWLHITRIIGKKPCPKTGQGLGRIKHSPAGSCFILPASLI